MKCLEYKTPQEVYLQYKSIPSGIGTITFGNCSARGAMYANTGMDMLGNFGGSIAPAFYDIKDANRAYKLINDLRNNQSVKS